jgi:hypothetical protein
MAVNITVAVGDGLEGTVVSSAEAKRGDGVGEKKSRAKASRVNAR